MYYNIGPYGGVSMKFNIKKLNFGLPQKYDQEQENIIYQSPFYGIKGSISKVVEQDNRYLVTRYDVDGKDGEVFELSKKCKNDLHENYISDIKNYLEINHTKYLTSLSNQAKSQFPKKKILILSVVLAAITAVSGLGIIFTTEAMFYLFSMTFFFSFMASCHYTHLLRSCLVEEKRQEFIHQYKEYTEVLNAYNITNEKNNIHHPTMYSNVSKIDQDKVIDIEKRKILNKKSA